MTSSNPATRSSRSPRFAGISSLSLGTHTAAGTTKLLPLFYLWKSICNLYHSAVTYILIKQYTLRPLNINKINFMEENRERFKKLATLRTNAVLYRLKVLGNCSNRQLYEYDEKEIDKIFSEIEKKVKEVKSKFHFNKRNEKFRL